MGRDVFSWPRIEGDFIVGDPGSPTAIAIVGRGEVEIPDGLYNLMGRYKTENLGIEKMLINLTSNPRIRFLIVCGKEVFGHFPGDALLKLAHEGVDETMRIMGTRAAIPYLCNIPTEAVDRFREQVEVIDLVHPKEVGEIIGYDPVYSFDEERREELITVLRDCAQRDPGPETGDPLVFDIKGLNEEGGTLGNRMNRLADHFTNQMLRMPSQKLSTSASIAIVSREFRVILDPIDMEIAQVPSIDLAGRLKSYLTGGQ